MSIVSNTSEVGAERIEQQMFLMNCPMPTINVLPTLVNITGFNVNYNLNYSTAHANTVTVFECYIDSITEEFGASAVVYDPDEGFFSLFDNAFAWMGYMYSSAQALFQKMYAFGTLVSYYISPMNFNVLGYTIDDLAGIALSVVIIIYSLCYIAVGAMMYKILVPSGGTG